MFILNIINNSKSFEVVERFSLLKPVQRYLDRDHIFQYETSKGKRRYELNIFPNGRVCDLYGRVTYGEDQDLSLTALYKDRDYGSIVNWDLHKHIAYLKWVVHKAKKLEEGKVELVEKGEARLNDSGLIDVYTARNKKIITDVDTEGLDTGGLDIDVKSPDPNEIAEKLYLIHIRQLARLTDRFSGKRF